MVRVNIFEQDSFVEISGFVDIRNQPITISHVPIPKIWESSDLNQFAEVESAAMVMYTLHCMNFAPDYRFVKLYDMSTTIDPEVDRPKFTIPIVADIPQNLQFPAGLSFVNALQIRVTRCLAYTDTNMAEDGDVHVTVTYAS